jgi:hypothetical protein
MAGHRLFSKDVYIRLDDGGTGFSYTVRYGGLRLPPRRVRVLEEGEELLGVEVRAIKAMDRPAASEQKAS